MSTDKETDGYLDWFKVTFFNKAGRFIMSLPDSLVYLDAIYLNNTLLREGKDYVIRPNRDVEYMLPVDVHSVIKYDGIFVPDLFNDLDKADFDKLLKNEVCYPVFWRDLIVSYIFMNLYRMPKYFNAELLAYWTAEYHKYKKSVGTMPMKEMEYEPPNI